MAKQSFYHTTLTEKSGEVIEGDIVNPDRSRVITKGGELITVAGTSYLKRNGAWTKIPGLDPDETPARSAAHNGRC